MVRNPADGAIHAGACVAPQAGVKEDEVCQLQATLKGAQYKLAAYKRENEKLADGAEATKVENTGVHGGTAVTLAVARLSWFWLKTCRVACI
jgi:nucleoid-associated protein YgaU